MEATLNGLWDKLNNGFLSLSYPKTKDSNPDVRHEMRLLMQDTVFQANLLHLQILKSIGQVSVVGLMNV